MLFVLLFLLVVYMVCFFWFMSGIVCIGMYSTFLYNAQLCAQTMFIIFYIGRLLYNIILYKKKVQDSARTFFLTHVRVLTIGIWTLFAIHNVIHFYMKSPYATNILFSVHDTLYCFWLMTIITLTLYVPWKPHFFLLFIFFTLSCPLQLAIRNPFVYDCAVYGINMLQEICIIWLTTLLMTACVLLYIHKKNPLLLRKQT